MTGIVEAHQAMFRLGLTQDAEALAADLRASQTVLDRATERRVLAVLNAREAGWSWNRIGRELGMSEVAARRLLVRRGLA